MSNRINRLVSTMCLLKFIAIVGLAPVSAVNFKFLGRWDLSKAAVGTSGTSGATGQTVEASRKTYKLYLPGINDGKIMFTDGAATHTLTFENNLLRIPDRSWIQDEQYTIYLALADRDLKNVKHMFKLTKPQMNIFNVGPWKDAYPNLCLLGTNKHHAKKLYPKDVFAKYERSFNTHAYEPSFFVPVQHSHWLPKFLMVSSEPLPPVIFEIEGRWHYRSLLTTESYLHTPYRSSYPNYVFKLVNRTTLTLNHKYSRAYVALTNPRMTQIKKIFLLTTDFLSVDIFFDSEYPTLCLLRADFENEGLISDHPKTFNDYQIWLQLPHSATAVFQGTPPENVPFYLGV